MNTELENKIKEAKREYYRKYREENREKINQRHREWSNSPEGKEKRKQARQRYWEKKAAQLLDNNN